MTGNVDHQLRSSFRAGDPRSLNVGLGTVAATLAPLPHVWSAGAATGAGSSAPFLEASLESDDIDFQSISANAADQVNLDV